MTTRSINRNSGRLGAGMAILAVLLTACGGGGGSAVPVGAIDGGGARNVVAYGPVNGFGSVIVNGVRYDTSQAEIQVNGNVATEAELEVGQLVRVVASESGSTLTASLVAYDDNVTGPVSAIDLAASTMTVLGQPVIINAGTSFDDSIIPRSLEGLTVGDIVEISGHVDSANRIVATRVELEDPGSEFEITGRVSNLDSAGMRFDINGLTVDYSQATLEDFAGGQVADGDLVEVEGTQFGTAGEFIAIRVEFEDDLFGDDDVDADVEIEGMITRFASAQDFDVAGIAVTTTSATTYDDGAAGDLALDVLVEVSGRFNSSGVLVADEIEFEREGTIRIDALVDAVDANAGTVTLLGITVQLDASTSMEDNTDLDLRPFAIGDINVGDWLEIRGVETGAGTNVVAASRLERDDPESEASIRGVATGVADPGFSILGLAIQTDGTTEFENTSRAEFFANAEGRLVEADGVMSGSQFIASSVEFED